MPNRAGDWFRQAERDLEQAVASARNGLHEWACFAAQQAAEKALRALHLAKSQEAWEHVVARLLAQLPLTAPPDLIEKARVLDNYYIPTRYANGHREGARLSSVTAPCKAAARSIMPIRSLTSSVLRWPDRRCVEQALQAWLARELGRHPIFSASGISGPMLAAIGESAAISTSSPWCARRTSRSSAAPCPGT